MSHTRRDFLKASLGASTLLSLGPAVPTFLSRSVAAGAARRGAADTILVVVQLAGGNDGLNTVVPYADDLYHRNRPSLRQVADGVHKIDSLLGFHPRMGAFLRLFKEGQLSVVQGVGYPKPAGGHFEAMRSWQTARPHRTACQTGWLGRAVDSIRETEAAGVSAVFVGRIPQPFTLNAEKTLVPSIRSLGESTLRTVPGLEGRAHRQRLTRLAELSRAGSGNPLVDFMQQRTLAAYAAGRQIEAVARAETSARPSAYPPFRLAEMFRIVAQLIRADLGIRIYYTELGGNEPGGFDNHANQLGNHCALLEQLSESVAAFVDDLKRKNLLDRVLLMTFSEFGRTVKENGRRGTGHGSAAPMFLAGGRVKGGLVGEHPNLADLENGGQKFHTDFRRVYAAVLDRWLGFDSRAVLGEQFEPLDVLDV